MARVTVEDCIDKVNNRFELVLLASHRARLISQGAPIMVDQDRDKDPVVALREIGGSALSPGDLKEDFIHSLQKHVEVDEPEGQSNAEADMVSDDVFDQDGEPSNVEMMTFDQVSEEALRSGIEGLVAPEKNDDY